MRCIEDLPLPCDITPRKGDIVKIRYVVDVPIIGECYSLEGYPEQVAVDAKAFEPYDEFFVDELIKNL